MQKAKRIWLIAVLLITASVLPVSAQTGGNVYDPTGNAPLIGGSGVTFTRVGNGYQLTITGLGTGAFANLPISVANGGTACASTTNPSTVAALDVAPLAGERCIVTDAYPCAPGAIVSSTGSGPDISILFDGSNWRCGEGSSGGALYSHTVNGVGSTTVPLTCTNTSGVNPSIDFYRSPLTIAAAATFQLPASGCADHDMISMLAVQGAGPSLTPLWTTNATGGVSGYGCGTSPTTWSWANWIAGAGCPSSAAQEAGGSCSLSGGGSC